MAPRADAAPPRLAKLQANLLWHEAELEAPSPAPSTASGARIRRTAGRDLGREADLFSGEMFADHSPRGVSADLYSAFHETSLIVADDGGQVLLCDAVSAEEALSLGLSPAGDSQPGPQAGEMRPGPHAALCANGPWLPLGQGHQPLSAAHASLCTPGHQPLEEALAGDWEHLVWGRAPESESPGGAPGQSQREMARTRTKGEVHGCQGRGIRTNQGSSLSTYLSTNQGSSLHGPTADTRCEPDAKWGHANMRRRASCPEHLDNSSRVYGAVGHRLTPPQPVAVKAEQALFPVANSGVQGRRTSPLATRGPCCPEDHTPRGQMPRRPAGRRLQRSLSGDSEGEGTAPSAGQQQRNRAGEGSVEAAPRPGRLQRSMSGDEEGTDGRRRVQSKTPTSVAAAAAEDWVPVPQVPVLELPVRRGARMQRSMDQDSEDEDGGSGEQRRKQTKPGPKPTGAAHARIQRIYDDGMPACQKQVRKPGRSRQEVTAGEGESSPPGEGKPMLNTRRVATKCHGDTQSKVKASPKAAQGQVQKANEVLTPRGSGLPHTRVSPKAQARVKKLERSLSGDSLGEKALAQDTSEEEAQGSPDKQPKPHVRLAELLPFQLRTVGAMESPTSKSSHARAEKTLPPWRHHLHVLKLEHLRQFSPRTPKNNGKGERGRGFEA